MKMQELMQNVGIDIASFELILNENNDVFVYDINVNTECSTNVEKHTHSGTLSVADYLKRISLQ